MHVEDLQVVEIIPEPSSTARAANVKTLVTFSLVSNVKSVKPHNLICGTVFQCSKRWKQPVLSHKERNKDRLAASSWLTVDAY